MTGSNMVDVEISVIIAAKNADEYVVATLDSILRQTVTPIEVLVVDDGSTDKTAALVLERASGDSRIRLLTATGQGPAAARNMALKVATGRWVSIVDADDLLHPMRFEYLLECAEREHADLVADQQIAFVEEGDNRRAWLLIDHEEWQGQRSVRFEDLFQAKRGTAPPLGYLKPLIRTDYLRVGAFLYDPSLIIGEDFDLLARLLRSGANMVYSSKPYYFYRRHAASLSHRLDVLSLDRMYEANENLRKELVEQGAYKHLKLVSRQSQRLKTLKSAQMVMDGIKSRRVPAAVKTMLSNPRSVLTVGGYLVEALMKRLNGIRALKANSSNAVDQSRIHQILKAGKEIEAGDACILFSAASDKTLRQSHSNMDKFSLGYLM